MPRSRRRRGKLTPPHERLARLIAVHAKGLIGKERRARKGELLHPGHFMVLVRRRNEFVNALVRELKREQIEVAGVDRLNLGEELAIQDLLAMARFVLLPQDDLNLACLLKSPLVGLDEDKLFTLAWNRKTHLWQALRERAHEPDFAAAHERLSRWLARADFTTPFEFFAQALGPEHGRKLLLERLGHEASDPIDELLSRALQYQRNEAASLQGFLRWFEAGGGEIKRDLDANRRQEVRILTVHASKGLQAPIVYLPDTTRVPNDLERLLAGENDMRLWLPRAGDANEAARAWRGEVRRRSLEEQNRLLYVAMTRAEDRLYVGGWIGSKPQDQGCWYDRIRAGLAASVEGESVEPRVQRHAQDLRLHEATLRRRAGGRRLRAGQPGPHRRPRAAGAAARSHRPARSLGARAGAGRARSADAARPLAAVARRGRAGAARLQPAGRGQSPLAARAAAARAAAPPAGPAGRRARRRRAPLPGPAGAWPERGGGRGMGRRGAGGNRVTRLTGICSPRARAPRCR